MTSPALRLIAAACALTAVACGSPRETSGPPPAAGTETRAPLETRPPAPPDDARPRIVALGDSLTAGLGLDREDAYPTLLQQKLDAGGLAFRVVNAGVSGDTSAGGLSRLDLALEGDVRILIVALGGNDALRALPAAELRRNLGQIIERAKARGVIVILAGMEAPPNFGRDYVVAFHQVFASLAQQHDVVLLPFLLEGVAGVERLNQRDGIHPTAEGARMIAEHVWSALEPVARAAATKGSPPR